jgi:hypothetical protein
MKNNEEANVGVVIGFIVTAIVLAIGVVILYQVQFRLVEAIRRTICNTSYCKLFDLVHNPEQPCHDHSERVQPSLNCANRKKSEVLISNDYYISFPINGRSWDTWRVIYARREPQSVKAARKIGIAM